MMTSLPHDVIERGLPPPPVGSWLGVDRSQQDQGIPLLPTWGLEPYLLEMNITAILDILWLAPALVAAILSWGLPPLVAIL